jgi:hypothetical protein
MRFKRILSVTSTAFLALWLSTWFSSAIAFSATPKSNTRLFKGAHISVQMPIDIYSTVLELDPGTGAPPALATTPVEPNITNIDISLTKRKELGGVKHDVGWICHGSVTSCAIASGTQNYWVDAASGEIRVGDPTEPVRKMQLGSWIAYEAFPLCGWTSHTGVFSPYGGQCYAVVLASDKKTVSFQILLGPNTGCKDVEKCWAKQLARLRRMMRSVE